MVNEVNDEEAQRVIVEHFQKLRKHQQQISSTISTLESEIREFESVLSVIRKFDPERKCYREVSGTLVCMKASDLIQLMDKIIEKQKTQKDERKRELVTKGLEIEEYRKEHNIRFLSQEEAMAMQSRATALKK